jgi:hypothetical protein
MLPAEPLLNDLVMCEKWNCKPWEVRGMDVESYRQAYYLLAILDSQVKAEFDYDEREKSR